MDGGTSFKGQYFLFKNGCGQWRYNENSNNLIFWKIFNRRIYHHKCITLTREVAMPLDPKAEIKQGVKKVHS